MGLLEPGLVFSSAILLCLVHGLIERASTIEQYDGMHPASLDMFVGPLEIAEQCSTHNL